MASRIDPKPLQSLPGPGEYESHLHEVGMNSLKFSLYSKQKIKCYTYSPGPARY